jgi:hypothetical protein
MTGKNACPPGRTFRCGHLDKRRADLKVGPYKQEKKAGPKAGFIFLQ